IGDPVVVLVGVAALNIARPGNDINLALTRADFLLHLGGSAAGQCGSSCHAKQCTRYGIHKSPPCEPGVSDAPFEARFLHPAHPPLATLAGLPEEGKWA